MIKYCVEIKLFNVVKIGIEVYGYVEFIIEGDNFYIKLEMFDIFVNIQYWEYFYGFLDGKDVSILIEV